MDPSISTSGSKTIKERFVESKQIHKHEFSHKILSKIPGISINRMYDKKTRKDDTSKQSKRGENTSKAATLNKSKEPSIKKFKHYLSEKVIEPKFNSGKIQPNKKQVYIALLDDNHFVNPEYNKMSHKNESKDKIKGHNRHKSNISVSKPNIGKEKKHQKNNSLVISLLAKNFALNKPKVENTKNLNVQKNIVVHRKNKSHNNFVKGKPFENVDDVKNNKDPGGTDLAIPLVSNKNYPLQPNMKKIKINSKDKNALKKYFFIIHPTKKIKARSKPRSLIENQKQQVRDLSVVNINKANISTKNVEQCKEASEDNKIDLEGENSFTKHKIELSEPKKKISPKFFDIFTNIQNDKETKDVRNIKKLIEDHIKDYKKVPDSSLQFYQIIKLLGKGSFGKVYLGLQRLTNRLVAIKCLEKDHFKDESTKRKILSEVRILKKLLGHPNIVKLLEVFENKKYVFFITEYATNGDLLKHTKANNAIPENDAKYMFYQIAMGIKYMHQQNIVHRDIKLDNILIDEYNRCKICDFGVSRQITPKESINEQCGTPAYLAPEIIKDQGYSGYGADIWSLGVLLFSLLTNQMPFKASTLDELHEKICIGRFEFPDTPKLSSNVKNLISKMLVVNPEDRIAIEEVIKHDWIKNVNFETTTIKNISEFEKNNNNYLIEYKYEINDFALNHVCELGFNKEIVEQSIMNKELNHASACYFNLEKDFV